MKKRTGKQVIALAAVVLLVAMYLITLLVAIFDVSASGFWFRMCLVCTLAVPLLAWIFIWIYGQVTKKKTIADLHLLQDSEPAEETKEQES